VALYDVGSADGIDFLVMEYVPGETLDKLIARGPLEIHQALAYAVAVAGAVAMAHKAGIVHRDLKPGNIMITEEGVVKVLDFGLAKLTEAPHSGAPQGAGSLVSMAGLILGTAAYMSPEQAQGQPVDARSDIFSFGVVLYEMLTGQRPFQGSDRTSTLSAIVRQEPRHPSEVNAKTPGDLERLVLRCMRKDPNARFQEMADVRAALEALQPAKAAARRRFRIGLAAAVILILTAGMAAYQWLHGYPEGKAGRELHERQITSNPIEDWVSSGAISPDGKRIAYRDQTGFQVRTIDTGETRPIALPRELWSPSAGGLRWFPDGGKLLADFITPEGYAIWVIPVTGGAPPYKAYSPGTEPAISPDGRSIAFTNGDLDKDGAELWVSGVDGSAPRKLATGNGRGSFSSPIWSPDGRWIAYLRNEIPKEGPISNAVEVRPAGGGPARTLVSGSSLPRYPAGKLPWWGVTLWSPDWRLLLGIINAGLWEIRVDPATCEARGKPEQLTPPAVAPAVSEAQGSVDWEGSLSVSADGKRLAFLKGHRLWKVDVGELGRGGRSLQGARRLTLDDRDSKLSGWTRDSKAVIFSSSRNGRSEIFRQAVYETVPELLVSSSANAWSARPSADGAWLLYWEQDQERPGTPPNPDGAPARIMRRPSAGGPAEMVLQSPAGSQDLSCPLVPGPPCAFMLKEAKQVAFYSFDPVRGLGGRIGQIDGASDWDLSPDGTRIAVVNNRDRVKLLTLSDRTWHEIPADPPGGRFTSINWASDGRGVFVVSSLPDSTNLLHVTTAGKVDRLLNRGADNKILGPLPSPDGKYLAFGAQGVDSNLWMIENF
jgi:Tol biopolymer transport system component